MLKKLTGITFMGTELEVLIVSLCLIYISTHEPGMERADTKTANNANQLLSAQSKDTQCDEKFQFQSSPKTPTPAPATHTKTVKQPPAIKAITTSRQWRKVEKKDVENNQPHKRPQHNKG
ncbi:hypothetical protein CHS0354_028615 [Potamilus streckersoni]|uniref:Uncharacterized protein n=1 Tax=Potamilus streckersoni TaxID=2493646 RepID=A0AAE0RUV3_9BIVA|nr:hypothetical protein CHS0354_028615 [Potamilus streckersoni]